MQTEALRFPLSPGTLSFCNYGPRAQSLLWRSKGIFSHSAILQKKSQGAHHCFHPGGRQRCDCQTDDD